MKTYNSGNIDNTNGTTTGVAGTIVGDVSVSNPGIFAKIEFKAKQAEDLSGTNLLNLSNVIVADSEANPEPIQINNGNVIIETYSDWDVNMDHNVNVLDMILVGQQWWRQVSLIG